MSDSETASIPVVGPCGSVYHFKCEYQKALVQCPKCNKVYRVPEDRRMESEDNLTRYLAKKGATIKADLSPQTEVPPWRKEYFIKQLIAGDETYEIYEKDKGDPISVAERDWYYVNFGIYFLLFLLLLGILWVAGVAPEAMSTGTGFIYKSLLFFVCAGILLRFKFKKRHINFWATRDKAARQFYVLDVNRIEFPTANYEIYSRDDQLIGKIKKSWFSDIFRRKWRVFDAENNMQFQVEEDALALSLLRRLLVNQLFWLRINFVLRAPNNQTMGEFNRQMTVRDEYHLDLSANRHQTDVRLLLATAVLLDSAERR